MTWLPPAVPGPGPGNLQLLLRPPPPPQVKVHKSCSRVGGCGLGPGGSQAAGALKEGLALQHPCILTAEEPEPRGRFSIPFKKEPWIRDLIPLLFKVGTRRSVSLRGVVTFCFIRSPEPTPQSDAPSTVRGAAFSPEGPCVTPCHCNPVAERLHSTDTFWNRDTVTCLSAHSRLVWQAVQRRAFA